MHLRTCCFNFCFRKKIIIKKKKRWQLLPPTRFHLSLFSLWVTPKSSLPPLSLHYTGERSSLVFLVLLTNQTTLTKSPRLKPVSKFSPNPFLLLFQIKKNSLFFKTLGSTKSLLLFHLFLVQGSQHILQLWILIKYVESCPTGDSVVIMFTLAPLF